MLEQMIGLVEDNILLCSGGFANCFGSGGECTWVIGLLGAGFGVQKPEQAIYCI